jgi:hypothetical protein
MALTPEQETLLKNAAAIIERQATEIALLKRLVGGDSGPKVVTTELLTKAQRPGGAVIGDAGDTLSDFASADITDAVQRGVAKRRADVQAETEADAERVRLLKTRGVLAPNEYKDHDTRIQERKEALRKEREDRESS